MKILVSGGTGFLGKHITNEFAKQGYTIYSKPWYFDAENVVWAPSSKDFNLLDRPSTDKGLAAFQPDTILHMAAICGGIVKNSHIPADFLRENTQMALNIYEGARQAGIKNIYSLGSVCMYPLHCPTPFKEDDIWNGAAEPTNFPYGQAKRTLLMLGQTYRAQYGFTGAHLVPVNMYGQYDSFDDQKSHVIPALIKKFVHAEEHNLPSVECLGTGAATREFLFAADAAQAIIKAVLTNFDYDLPINLGIGKDITIKDLAILIKRLTNYEGEITFKSDGLDGQPKRLLDVSRAKQLLGWEAKTELEQGLQQTIEWYQANKSVICHP